MTDHARPIPLVLQTDSLTARSENGPYPTKRTTRVAIAGGAAHDAGRLGEPPLPPSPGGVTRRAALQGLAAGLGLAVATPGETLAGAHDTHPLAAHVAQRPAKPATARAATKPQFFDAHQYATLTLVSELIVPGSVASGSPAYIDDVLAIEHDDVRQRFVGALASVDSAARDAHGTTFRALPAAQQPALLEALATLPTLKSWIAGAHYSSEAGMKELGFTGNMFFQSFPACTHAEGHE